MKKKILSIFLFSSITICVEICFGQVSSRGDTGFKKTHVIDQLNPMDALLNADYLKHLSGAISYKTLSFDNNFKAHGIDFLRFHEYLKETFPLTHATLKREVVHKYSLLYTWKGTNPNLEPFLFLAHQDVVQVDSAGCSNWMEPAFSGCRKDGYIWGRGTMDNKVSLIAILESIETLLKSGYKPERDIYLAFGHDEESCSSGAIEMSTLLESRGLHFKYILDEGGSIIDGMVPYINKPVAFIGIAEKGYLTLELSVNGLGGHSAMPMDEGIVGILSGAVYRLQKCHFHPKFSTPVKEMCKVLGKNMSGFKSFVISHPTFFSGAIKQAMHSNPISKTLFQTTLVPTIIEAGMQDNVIPSCSHAIVNIRIIPGETVESVIKKVKRTINDKRVNIITLNHTCDPSKIADINSSSYLSLKKTIEEVFTSTIVSPGLNIAFSDSRNYSNLSDNLLRFLPLILKKGDGQRIHGDNERIEESNYKQIINFYYQLIINSAWDF